MIDRRNRPHDGLAVQQSLLDAVLHSSLLAVRSSLRRGGLPRGPLPTDAAEEGTLGGRGCKGGLWGEGLRL